MCTGCVVQRSLVSRDQESDVTLINETTQSYPLALIDMDCPFLLGKLRLYVWKIRCMSL